MKINKQLLVESFNTQLIKSINRNDKIINKEKAISIVNEESGADTILRNLRGQNKLQYNTDKVATKWNSLDRQSQEQIAGAVGTVVGITAIVSFASYLYNNWGTKANRACNHVRGKKKQKCIYSFKYKGCQKAIESLIKNKDKCKNHKNPEKCINRIDKEIASWQRKAEKLKHRVEAYD